MKHMRMRNRSKIDGTKIGEEMKDKLGEEKELDELGQKFLADKKKFEQEYEKIENDPTLERKHKINQLNALKRAVEKLQEEYDKKVAEKQEEVDEEIKEMLEEALEAKEALEEEIESLQETKMDVTEVDTSEAIKEAEVEKEKFRKMHAQNVEELNMRIEQQQLLKREILRNKLSGR